MIETTIQQRESIPEVTEWLSYEAKKLGIGEELAVRFSREEGKWLYFYVRSTATQDILDFVKRLVEIEDAWRERRPPSVWRLMLLPA